MYDAIVVGARCAGSPVGMLLARAGHKVLIVERDTFPSDTLSTAHMQPDAVIRMTKWGLIDRLIAAGTPPYAKMNVGFGDIEMQTPPAEIPAYAPRRTVLDPILMQAARESGAEVREGCSVQEVLKDAEGRVTGVRLQENGSDAGTESARIVIGDLAPDLVVGAAPVQGAAALVAADRQARQALAVEHPADCLRGGTCPLRDRARAAAAHVQPHRGDGGQVIAVPAVLAHHDLVAKEFARDNISGPCVLTTRLFSIELVGS